MAVLKIARILLFSLMTGAGLYLFFSAGNLSIATYTHKDAEIALAAPGESAFNDTGPSDEVTSASQCAAYENYPGAEPPGYAEHCLGISPASPASVASPHAPSDTGFAQDIGFVSDNFVSFTLNDFPGQTFLGSNIMVLFGMDFDPTATTLYALDNSGQQLGTIDLSNGAFAPIGPSVPLASHTWTGLTIDPVNGTFYASSTSGSTAALYTLQPSTGAATLVYTQTVTPLLIDIAMNPDGVLYGHDIATDAIYILDTSIATATLVGPTGYNANFAQGMDFDNDDGTLYIFLYIGGGANVYGTVDLSSGAVTPLATDNPLGEFEGAIQNAVETSITLTKTVGTDASVCAVTDSIAVNIGTAVTYCYEVSNDGDVTLNLHSLVDSEMGTILNHFPYGLAPGASAFLTQTTTILTSTTNAATWTAFNANMSYAYDDSAPYNFIDISSTGTPLNLEDDGEANATMPFGFTFFGTTSNQVRIGNNGGIRFATTIGDIGFTNSALPNAVHPLTIFPYWDDLDSETGNVYYETIGAAPNRAFIVQWHERPHFPGPGLSSVTLQAILYEGTNEILFQYADLDFGDPVFNYGASATVGLNKDGVSAVQYSFNTAVLTDSMAILWTPLGMATATDTATVNVLIPEIAVDPSEIVASQVVTQVLTYTLTISNIGEGILDWTIDEEAPAATMQAGVPVSSDSDRTVEVVTSASQCAAYENYPGAEPVGYAEHCLGIQPPSPASVASPHAPTDTGFAQDIGFVSDNFVSFTLNDFPGQTFLGSNTMALFGYDFDPTATTLYALDNSGQQLGTIDLSNGAFTPIGPSIPLAGHTWSGLTIDPVNGAFYASSTSGSTAALYTLQPSTGAATLVYTQTVTPLLIDIAMNTDGVLYGHDIATDAIYILDTSIATATLVGPTGYNANFAQGMDFDNDDGTLYIFLYIGGGANVYGTVDLSSGAVTPLATDNPLGEFEGAIQNVSGPPQVCSTLDDIPWVTLSPTSGATPGGGSSDVMVTVDTTGLTVGGIYTGTLCINSNDLATPLVTVPLTITVIPAVYGVELSADMAASGEVGTTVTYTLYITNTGNTGDTFDLATSGVWATSLSAASLTLAAGERTSVMVWVNIPPGAADGSSDTAIVTAISQSDPSASDTVRLTTTAIVPTKYIYLPAVFKD